MHLHLLRPDSFHSQQGRVSIPTHHALASYWGVEGQGWMEAQSLNSQPLGGKIPFPRIQAPWWDCLSHLVSSNWTRG